MRHGVHYLARYIALFISFLGSRECFRKIMEAMDDNLHRELRLGQVRQTHDGGYPPLRLARIQILEYVATSAARAVSTSELQAPMTFKIMFLTCNRVLERKRFCQQFQGVGNIISLTRLQVWIKCIINNRNTKCCKMNS